MIFSHFQLKFYLTKISSLDFTPKIQVKLLRAAKLIGIIVGIFIGFYGAVQAVLREDNTNCFLALFSINGPVYLLSAHVISKHSIPLRHWPLHVIYIHIYTNAFFGFLAIFGVTCFLVISILLDSQHFDPEVYEIGSIWLMYSFIWQIIVGFTLKEVADWHFWLLECERHQRWFEYTRYVEMKRREYTEWRMGKR